MAANEIGELSERELEILRLVATGASNKEIAQVLFISSNTVRVHLRNIFNKINVNSRTEAAMHAVRIGLVQTSRLKVADDEGASVIGETRIDSVQTNQPISFIGPWLQRWGIVILLVMILSAIGIGIILAQLPPFQNLQKETPILELQPSPTALQRWQERTALPTARNSLALAAFENQIYAIAGETAQGVTGVVERYDPVADEWTILGQKPTAVADIGAVVIGGKIYIPGGRTGSGQPTDVLEVYDPNNNTWETHASLPAALSGYAIVGHEGMIYIFGGWTGSEYTNSAYAFDPGLNEWQVLTSMPTPRGYCGAAISSNQIYVLGGMNETDILDTTEIYFPSRDNGIDTPWQNGPSLPQGRYAMGISSASDLIYLIGGIGEPGDNLPVIEYSPTSASWQTLSTSIPSTWSSLGTVSLGQYLYVMGGLIEGNPSGINFSYQAIFTVVLPFVR